MYELFQLSTYAAKKASDIILKYYFSTYEVQMKGKGNPVTDADIEADEALLFDSYLKDESDLELGEMRLLEVDNRLVLPVQKHIRVIVTAADVLHC